MTNPANARPGQIWFNTRDRANTYLRLQDGQPYRWVVISGPDTGRLYEHAEVTTLLAHDQNQLLAYMPMTPGIVG